MEEEEGSWAGEQQKGQCGQAGGWSHTHTHHCLFIVHNRGQQLHGVWEAARAGMESLGQGRPGLTTSLLYGRNSHTVTFLPSRLPISPQSFSYFLFSFFLLPWSPSSSLPSFFFFIFPYDGSACLACLFFSSRMPTTISTPNAH